MTKAHQFSNPVAVAEALRRATVNLIPPADVLPSVWAEDNVRIPVGNAKPGPIRFDNAPPQRGMIDVIKQPGIRRVTYKLGAQMGKTTIQQCIAAYFIKHEPKSQIFAQPSQGDIQTFQETKLRPMLDANPELSSVMAKQRGREGVNNSRMISYIGGWLMFCWSGSPKTARGRSAPVIHQDEIDGYDPLPEGDFSELLAQRAASFGDEALRTESSTPTIEGSSRISIAYEEGDQRRFYVPCPHCGHAQVLKWENVTWQGRLSTGIDDAEEDIGKEHLPETAGYACEGCGAIWTDGERIASIRDAEKNGGGWRAAKPFRGHASFHGPEMLSTFRKMRDIVQSYLDKLSVGDMQSFVNVSLAEVYAEKGEKADPSGLQLRAEEYRADVPMGGLYLTAGIDMQMDRLECEIVAWGEADESWSIAYYVLWGDPLQQDVWDDLDDVLAGTYQHESGAIMSISSACLDTGGTNGMTQAAYDYAKGKTGRRLFAIKGIPGWGRPIVEKPQRKQSGKNSRKVDLFRVGVDEGKLIVMRRLAATVGAGERTSGPGYCHTPTDRDAEWYKQITAEKLVTKYVKGQPYREWHKPDRARNEALDCRVYAYAALKIMNPSFKRLADRFANPDEDAAPTNKPTAKRPVQGGHIKPEGPKEIPQEEAKPPQTQTKPTIKRSKSVSGRNKGGWVRGW